MTFREILIASLAVTLATCAAQAGEPVEPPPPVGEIRVEVPPGDWIAGTPLWLRMTVINRSDKDATGPARAPGPFRVDEYSFELADATTGGRVAGTKFIHFIPSTPPPRPRPTYYLIPARDVRTFFDRRCWSEMSQPVPGKYRLTISVGSAFRGSVLVTVRQPTEEEKPFLKDQAMVDAYSYRAKYPPPPADAPESIRQALGMDWLLHTLYTTPKIAELPEEPSDPDFYARRGARLRGEIKQFDAEGLGAGLPEFYAPLVDLLRYEIFYCQGDKKAEPLKEKILREYPGLAWVFPLYGDRVELSPLMKGRYNAN